MSYRIVWHSNALKDLDLIYDFYYYKSPKVADSIYHSIVAQVKYLKHHPNIAPVEPLMADKPELIRSLTTKDGLFKIIYYQKENSIIIARIWCCRKNPKNMKF